MSPSSVAEVGEYTGEYENGVNRFSKDPLALVTRQGEFYGRSCTGSVYLHFGVPSHYHLFIILSFIR